MVIDTSALVAVLFDEPERPALAAAIDADPLRLVSAATLLETSLVVESRRGEPAGRELDLLLHRIGADIVAVDADQAEAGPTSVASIRQGPPRGGAQSRRLLQLRTRPGTRTTAAVQG